MHTCYLAPVEDLRMFVKNTCILVIHVFYIYKGLLSWYIYICVCIYICICVCVVCVYMCVCMWGLYNTHRLTNAHTFSIIIYLYIIFNSTLNYFIKLFFLTQYPRKIWSECFRFTTKAPCLVLFSSNVVVLLST